MRIGVVGAGVAGLAAGVRLAGLGHEVCVLEAGPAPGGKCGRVTLGPWTFDSGPSLLTMPWVLRELFAETGAPVEEELDLRRVEPVTRYRFADGSGFDARADLPDMVEGLEAWSPGAGADWVRLLGACAGMWRASLPVLRGPPPWPPRRPRAGDPRPDPRDLVRVRPWRTLRGLARAHCRDPRLRLVVERAATYAGADPRRAPAALALAGYVEHAFGAWHVGGGLYAIVEALARRLCALGGELRLSSPVRRIALSDGRVRALETDAGPLRVDAAVSTIDTLALYRDLLPGSAAATRARARLESEERSLSGFALMLGLRERTPGLAHHTILFPADYDAEFDDVFLHRRPARDPTLYVAASSLTDPGAAPEGGESWFVLVNAPTHGDGLDWDAVAERYEEEVLARLAARGWDVRGRIEARARRTPADLERETGAPGGAIYGTAPHGRLGTLGRPAGRSPVARNLWLAGGTTHPGGGLPLVMLGAKRVAEEVGRAP
jgi:phytoene desaturase